MCALQILDVTFCTKTIVTVLTPIIRSIASEGLQGGKMDRIAAAMQNMEIWLDGALKFLYKRTQERVKRFFFIFNNT